jgi:hypothetical protein
VVQVTSGSDLCHFLNEDGTVTAWQVGTAVNPSGAFYTPFPVPADAGTGVMAMGQSGTHVVVLKRDGSVAAWGAGDGAVPEAAGAGVVSIAAGPSFAAALKADGSVIAWKSDGTLLVPPAAGTSSAVRIGAEPDAVSIQRTDGSWVLWKLDGTVVTLPAPADVTLNSGTPSFALGTDHVAYQWNGTDWVRASVPSWAQGYLLGRSESLILAIPRPPVVVTPPESRTVDELTFVRFEVAGGGVGASYSWMKDDVPVSGGSGAVLDLGRVLVSHSGRYTVRITSSLGTVTSAPAAVLTVRPVTEPDNGVVSGLLVLPRELQTGVVQISAGRSHVLGLRRDGSVAAWRIGGPASLDGEAIVPAGALSGVVEVQATELGSLALKADGTVLYWGRGGAWKSPPGPVRSLSGGGGVFVLDGAGSVLQRDPATSRFGTDGLPAAARSGVVALAGWQGANLGIALKDDGSVFSLGTVSVPIEVQSDVIAISSAVRQPRYTPYDIAIKRDGTVFEWDERGVAQVADVSIPGARAVASTGFGSAALKVNGVAATWGNPESIPESWQGRILGIQAFQAYNQFVALLSPAPVGLGAQSINFPQIPDIEFGFQSTVLSARASSGLRAAFEVVSGPASISGGSMRVEGVGTVVLRATQAGDGVLFGPASVTQSVQIIPGPQHIRFPQLPDRQYSAAPVQILADSDSFLPVEFAVEGPASFHDSLLWIEGVGVVTVTARQAGNVNFRPADPVVQSFRVDRAFQLLKIEPIPSRIAGPGTFTVGATASSGLPVRFAVLDGPATISGHQVTISGPGTVMLEVSQAGDSMYLPVSARQSIQVGRIPQTVSVVPPPARSYMPGEQVTLAGTASSGLPVAWTLDSGPGTLVGDRLTILGAGTFHLTARQAGNDTVQPADPVGLEFVVSRASQTVVIQLQESNAYRVGMQLPIGATSTSGLPVEISVADGPGVVSQGTLTLTGAGSLTLVASQPGDANYLPVAATRSLTILPRLETLTVVPVANRAFILNQEIALEATASSGSPVRFRLQSGPGTLAGNRIVVLGAGVFRVTASEDAPAGVTPADPVTIQFEVVAASQSIDWAGLAQPSLGGRAIPLQAQAGSGLPVQFTILDGPGVILPEGLQATDLGLIRVAADQPGNANYLAAERRIQTVSALPGMDLVLPAPGGAALPALRIVLPAGHIAFLERAESLGRWSSMGPVIGLGLGNPVYLPIAAPPEGASAAFWRIQVPE